jgi:hypothetical protein
MELDEFNTNITQWGLLQKLLTEKGIKYWNVTDQWNRTAYSKKYSGKPFAMILLQLHRKFVVLVWGNSKYYSIEPRHSISAIITALPRTTALP